MGGNEENPKAKFGKGTRVEVKRDEVGFEGAWFGATIIDRLRNYKYLVEYHHLVTEDETAKLREEAILSDMRPFPPHTQRICPFQLLEIVDAWYNDGWWLGRIVKVKKGLRYTVFFKMGEELEFEHCELRTHQEWIDGNWIIVSKDWEL
uniref:Agenet domain-containing protein n=1 Tax=Rhizophora mucronata TaxID=61149 RepID=A0A2P2IM23_RHIMU